jgi:hypothetical protein
MKGFFSFPNPVNDAAARSVALGVVAMATAAVLGDWSWLLIPLTYGFFARVAAGPKISPLGQFAVRVAAPRLVQWQKFVPGPPKRFAQAIGVALCVATDIVTYTNGFSAARWILVPLIGAASLEGFAGFCLGCTIFGWGIRLGLVPDSVCAECGDLSARFAAAGFPVTKSE